LGITNTNPDWNTGEQISSEGMADSLYASAASATSNSVTVAGNQTTMVIGQILVILSGPGTAEYQTVASATYNSGTNTTTYTLSGNFAVTPTAGSDIQICSTPYNLVFYQNILNHRTDSLAGNDTGSTGFLAWGSEIDAVYDDNTVNNTRLGIGLHDYDNIPLYYVDVINNTFSGVQSGIGYLATNTADPQFVGVAARNNSISGASASYNVAGAGFSLYQSSTTGATTLNTIEHNTLTGFPVGAVVLNEPHTLIYKNTFALGTATYSGSAGISFNGSASVLLQGNTYTGFSSTYGGTTPTPIGATPYDTFYLTSTGGTTASQLLSLLDDGATSLSWSVSSSASWLTFSTSSGSISAEGSTPSSGTGSVSLLANPTGLSFGSYFSTVTITFGSETRTIGVYLLVE
jgi:hypothetical protein